MVGVCRSRRGARHPRRARRAGDGGPARRQRAARHSGRPLAEETFFRGFFYRALRNRLGAPAATTIVSVLFGAIHYTGPDTVTLLPMLALLGALFCLLYELTGSLWPTVALHTINNALAFGGNAGRSGAVVVAVVVGGFMLAVCVLVPALARPGRSRRSLRPPASA